MASSLAIEVLAIAMAVCGIYLLRTAWAVGGGAYGRIVGGWALSLFGVFLWTLTTSPERGVAIGLLVFMGLALCFVGPEIWAARPVRSERRTKTSLSEPQVSLQWKRGVATGLLMVPGAALSALGVAAASFVLMHETGVEHTAGLTWVMVLFPALWAGLAMFAGFDPQLPRKALVVLVPGLLSFTFLLVGA